MYRAKSILYNMRDAPVSPQELDGILKTLDRKALYIHIGVFTSTIRWRILCSERKCGGRLFCMRHTNFSSRKNLVKHFYANAFTGACYKAFEYIHDTYIYTHIQTYIHKRIYIYILTSHINEIDLSTTRGETHVSYTEPKRS